MDPIDTFLVPFSRRQYAVYRGMAPASPAAYSPLWAWGADEFVVDPRIQLAAGWRCPLKITDDMRASTY